MATVCSGVILEVELRVVPNECYRLEQFVVPIGEALEAYEAAVAGLDGVRLVYARLNIVPEQLFDEAIVNVFHAAPEDPIPPLREPGLVALRRAVFRGSTDSDYGKQLRWMAETRLQPKLQGERFSRNQLMNEGADVFENRSPDTTDILHEYFVPRSSAGSFLGAAKGLVREHGADLLNVTVREVLEDTDTFLRYADRPMLAFVMLFHQARTAQAEERMRTLTRGLIDAAAEAGGRYYLPYRLHATQEQFERAYPRARAFFQKKREHDPQELFQNRFYLRYGRTD